MRKEKIIEMIVRHSIGGHFRGYHEIAREDCENIADELFALIDQEKKDVVKEVLQIILKCFNYWKIEQNKVDAIMILAKEYGVEL